MNHSAARVLLAIAFRYTCYTLMMALCLLAERRPAPHLPDLLVDRIPYSPLIDRYNYWLLLITYIPMNLVLLYRSRPRFIRYTISAGLIALLRGVTICLTGLGPVRGPDVNAALSDEALRGALWSLISPVAALRDDAVHLYLTKDLFFSGHTAVTFLLLLYVWPYARLRWVMLVLHVLVVASVLVAHLHYSIDIVGAYAITFALFILREAPVRRLLVGAPIAAAPPRP